MHVYTLWGKPMSVDICLYSVGEAHEWMCMYEYNICDILIYNNNSDME